MIDLQLLGVTRCVSFFFIDVERCNVGDQNLADFTSCILILLQGLQRANYATDAVGIVVKEIKNNTR